jgi:hypothetical protein
VLLRHLAGKSASTRLQFIDPLRASMLGYFHTTTPAIAEEAAVARRDAATFRPGWTGAGRGRAPARSA